MKFSLLVSIFLYSGIIIGQQKIIDNDSIKEWNTNNKLTWSDFAGKPNDDIYGAAMTSYKIEINPSNVLVDENDKIQDYENMSVKAIFYKHYSWAIIKNTELLHHEQLHFDIAELFARKIRKRFNELQANKISKFSIYQECYDSFWIECRKLQKEYDAETRNGREKETNKVWSIQIKNDLKSYNTFK